MTKVSCADRVHKLYEDLDLEQLRLEVYGKNLFHFI